MANFWRFLRPVLSASMQWLRLGEEKRKIELQNIVSSVKDENIMSASATQGGHKNKYTSSS